MAKKFDLGARNPLKRVGDHQELANLVAYLVSDYSDYINGEVVTIDGGEWLQGAGQFNLLNEVSSSEWDMIENMVKNVKGS
jgi:enoyl-[acyl-carrier-protein] reductase (NADH)